MFEKEAEERITGQFGTSGEYVTRQRIWQDGALFGYNKANEWHFVKNGDLPDEDDVYLVYTTKGVLLGHQEQGVADGETTFYDEPYSDFTEYPSEMLFTEDEIIAWKEIVPPELPKEKEKE